MTSLETKNMKTKFKIGDKVKVILNSIFQGETGKIFEIRNDIVEVEMLDTNHLFFCEDEIKLLPKQKKEKKIEKIDFGGIGNKWMWSTKTEDGWPSEANDRLEKMELMGEKVNELIDTYNNDRRNRE